MPKRHDCDDIQGPDWLKEFHDGLHLLPIVADDLTMFGDAFGLTGNAGAASYLRWRANLINDAHTKIGQSISRMLSEGVKDGHNEIGIILKAMIDNAGREPQS